MGFTRRPKVNETLFLTPLLLLFFLWSHVVSLDNPLFIVFFFFSLFFIGFATFLLVSTDIESVSRRVKRVFQTLLIVTILFSVVGASSIAVFSRGGARHSFAVRPDDFNLTLKYGSWAGGYIGRQEWTILKADYAVGAVFADYFIDFVNIFVNNSVNLNGHIWAYLNLLPNHYMADTVFKLTEATFVLNGSETGVILNPSHWLTVHWGSFGQDYRARIDRGYTVTFFVTLQLEGADYGDLGITIPLKGESYPMFRIDDLGVSSQVQDGLIILVTGIFAGIQIQTLAKSLEPSRKKQEHSGVEKSTV